MPEWLIWTIVILIWIGIQVCDFKGIYSVNKGVLGEYTATSFSESRDGIVFLIICWGLYQGFKGCTATMGDVLFFTCPWTISKIFKFIKEIRRELR
jgi:hypothetical protein